MPFYLPGKWFRAFAARSFSTCRPLRPRGVRWLLAPNSFANDDGLHPLVTDSALPSPPSSTSDGPGISGLLRFASLRPVELLASLVDPTEAIRPSRQRLLRPGFQQVGHPSCCRL